MQMKALWVQVIKGKHGEEEGGWSSCIPREGYGVGMWKDLRKFGHLVSNKMFFCGSGWAEDQVLGDRWCGDSPLCDAFLSLSVLALAKEAWVGDVWSAE